MYIRQGLRFWRPIVVCGLFLGTLLPVPVQAQTLSWKRQLGTSGSDYSSGVVTDSNGNVYISGNTEGSLGGSNQGYNDAWVAKYNSSGTLMWKRQLRTSIYGGSRGVATDSNGNVYISGNTEGSLGGSNQGYNDAWVAKYNSGGTLVWKRQLGTSSNDSSNGVATDSNGNVYMSGTTEGSLGGAYQGGFGDAWIAKYNSSGTLMWKRQLGTSAYEECFGVATDSNGSVYISGYTQGSLAGTYQGFSDAWVAKYNSSGALVWKRQLGTSGVDLSLGVATDSNGSVYISGSKGTNTFVDEYEMVTTYDALVAKYNSSGTLMWKRQLGTSSNDSSNGVTTDSNGNVYISGATEGSLAGSNQGYNDAWVAKYNSSGTLVWKRQLGTSGNDYSSDVAIDSNDHVYMSGTTEGSLGGANQGGIDVWLVKYNQ